MVVVLGWGVVPEPHWLIQNSWSDEWGDHGKGKISMRDLVGVAVLDSQEWKVFWTTPRVVVIVSGSALVYYTVLWCSGWARHSKVKVKSEDPDQVMTV